MTCGFGEENNLWHGPCWPLIYNCGSILIELGAYYWYIITCGQPTHTSTHISPAKLTIYHIDDLVEDCSNSIALAMELLQFYTEPLMSTCVSKLDNFDGLVQVPSNSSVLAVELLQSYTKPRI